MGHLSLTIGHLRLTIGHLRVIMGHLRLTIGYLKATVVHIRVTLGHLRVTIDHLRVTIGFFSISKHKANTNELHPKVRQTCLFIKFYILHTQNLFSVSRIRATCKHEKCMIYFVDLHVFVIF